MVIIIISILTPSHLHFHLIPFTLPFDGGSFHLAPMVEQGQYYNSKSPTPRLPKHAGLERAQESVIHAQS